MYAFTSFNSQLHFSALHSKKTCQSPEILHRRISAAPEDLFRRWAFRSAPALDFRKWQRNLSASRKSNGAATFEHQSRDVSYQTRGILVTQTPLEPRGCFDLGEFCRSARIGSVSAFRIQAVSPPPPSLPGARGRMMPEVPPRRDRALVTPQLDFGFHKASPLFTLTGCAGY